MSKKKLGGIISGIIIMCCLILAWESGNIIKPGYVGIVYSMNNGVKNKVLNQGLNFVSPFEQVKKYSVATEQAFLSKDKREGSENDDSCMLPTKDGKIVNADIEFAYHFDAEQLPKTFARFKAQEGKEIEKTFIRGKIKSWAAEVSSNFSVIDIYGEKRTDLNSKMLKHCKEKFKEYGIVIDSVNFPRIGLDTATARAIQERINAQQQLQKAKIDKEKAEIDAQKKAIEAKGIAESEIIKANGQAEANKRIQQNLTNSIIEYKKIEKWNGIMPQVIGEGNAILDMRRK